MVQYAGFWRRAMAALIDAILIGGVCLLIIGSSVLERSDGLAALAIVSLIAGPLAYHAACEATSWHGSVGKRLMGLRVLDLEGQKLELGRAVLRNAGKVLSALIANVGFAAAGFTSRKQALHDVLTGAVVVRGPLPEAAAFERQVLADYRPGQDRMRSLGVLALLAALAGAYRLGQSSSEYWTATVYPDASTLLIHEHIGVYSTLPVCRAAVRQHIEAAGYVNPDYECGLNCRPWVESDPESILVCERTER